MWKGATYARTWKNMLWILRKSWIFGLIYVFIRWQIEHPIFLNTYSCWILGGIKGYSFDKMNVLKWYLNRPKHAKELFEFAGMRDKPSHYKPLRDIQIKRSEKCVGEVIEILDEKVLKLFGTDAEQDKESVYNLSSGQQYQVSADDLVGIQTMGQALYNDFKKDRLFSTTIKFHDRNAKSWRFSVMLAYSSRKKIPTMKLWELTGMY